MPIKNPESYCLFKKQTPSGRVWYVKFWDHKKNHYHSFRSTGIPVEGKRERRREAENAAKKLLDSFTEKKQVQEIINKPLFQFWLDFWTPNSEYVREKRFVDKKPLSTHYIESSRKNIEKYAIPFSEFKGITVGELTRAKVRAWKLWAAERGLSGRKINIVLQTMRVPIRNAYKDEMIPTDPFLILEKRLIKKGEKERLLRRKFCFLFKKGIEFPLETCCSVGMPLQDAPR
jgi:hypothetical protein